MFLSLFLLLVPFKVLCATTSKNESNSTKSVSSSQLEPLEITDTDEYEHLVRLIDYFLRKMENKLWDCDSYGKNAIKRFRMNFAGFKRVPLIREGSENEEKIKELK